MTPRDVKALPAPSLNIPKSDHTVHVSVIDTSSRIVIPAEKFLQPQVGRFSHLDCPAYSFLIEHQAHGKRYLFDLGVRKDWQNLAPTMTQAIQDGGWGVEVHRGVSQILAGHGTDGKVDGVIWRSVEPVVLHANHYHFDHTGDLSTFDPSTELVVGPGFKKHLVPGYPAKNHSVILETDYSGRNLREINFEDQGNGLNIGRCPATDFFGDGSFYLLDTPGHAIGHICGLARTTPSTFILMGGDACHHAGEFRPTAYVPLPLHISPHPLDPGSPDSCPSSMFEAVHPKHSRVEPFYDPAKDGGHDIDETTETIRRLEEFDASEDIFVILAHDESLLSIIDFYPQQANGWKAKGWGSVAKWRFLKDFV